MIGIRACYEIPADVSRTDMTPTSVGFAAQGMAGARVFFDIIFQFQTLGIISGVRWRMTGVGSLSSVSLATDIGSLPSSFPFLLNSTVTNNGYIPATTNLNWIRYVGRGTSNGSTIDLQISQAVVDPSPVTVFAVGSMMQLIFF